MSSKSPIESDEGVSKIATPGVEYEVFLSFRGPDTRSGFTDFFYVSLTDAGIRVYRDDEELRKGEKIGPELLRGIRESKIAIPIFSKGYAASKWCLMELAQIVECKKINGLKVMPIFYDVTPFEVRNQTGDYAKAFEFHEIYHDEDTVKSWKTALTEVGELSGWDIHSGTNRFFKKEGELVKEVTKVLLRELKKAYLVVTDHLVGVEHHVKEILSMSSTNANAVQIIGVYGMGGIGKTTLAKVIYNHLLPNFESHSFLADIRETSRSKGMKILYERLISDILGKESANISNNDEGINIVRGRFSNKKVVILLDDVDEISQLEGLIGKRGFFGHGSRIIVTTRNKSILDSFIVDWCYELGGLETHLALQLFSRYAFRTNNPPKEYSILSKKAVRIMAGLPLALEVLGSNLCGKSSEVWESILNKLEEIPHQEIRTKLSVTYETLDTQQQQIFLDIACFFIGEDYRTVIHFWEDSQYPEEAIEVLKQMSLIRIQKDHKLWMHDQLRDLGREIVQEKHTEHKKCSRLWNTKKATELFMRKKVSENIQGICLDMRQQSGHYFGSDKFANLQNLRLLWVKYNDHHPFNPVIVQAKNFKAILKDSLRRGHPFIFSELRWLSLHGFFRMRFTRKISFQKLSILDLSYSSVESSWSGWSHIKMGKNLKVLNLTGCRRLVKTPDFSCHLLLEQLILEECSGLVEIDKSIGMLQHLVIINLRGCRHLKKLPKELRCVESLEELHIAYTSIVEIPSWPLMKRLKVFDPSFCLDLEKVSSLDFVVNITELSLRGSRITILPDSIGKLVNLLKLCLIGCKGIRTLPESIGDLVSLVKLDLQSSGIVKLPDTIGNLRNLKTLAISGTRLRRLPTAIGRMENLVGVYARDCSQLHDIPKLPMSLISLEVSEARIPRIPDISNLINLKHLELRLKDGPVDTFEASSSTLWWIRRFINLETLTLQSKCIISFHDDLSSLRKLRDLYVWSCPNLVEILDIDMLENLEKLSIKECAKLPTLSNLSNLKKLKDLEVQSCPDLVEIPGIDMLENLEKLSIRECPKLQSLPNLSNLKKLKDLEVQSYPNLDDIPGIDMFESLTKLSIGYCRKLQSLPGLSNLKKLQDLEVQSWPNVVEIPNIDMLQSLTKLSIENCGKLQRLPDLSNLKKLKDLEVQDCPALVEITGRMVSLRRLKLRNCRSLEKFPVANHKTMHFFSIEHCGKKDNVH